MSLKGAVRRGLSFSATVLTFLAVLAGPVMAQQGQPFFLPVVSNYDFDSATATYCVLGPLIESATFVDPATSVAVSKIQTSGSSATTTATTGTTAFTATGLGKGSELSVVSAAGVAQVREVLAVGSGSSLTVNAAWTLSSTSWSYRNITCGTGITAGWFGVRGFRDKTIVMQVDQLSLASGSLAVTVQCKGSSPWAQPVPVYPPTGGSGQCGTGLFTTAARCALYIPEPWSYCRVGVTIAADDGGDTGANLEQVTVYLEATK